MYQIVSKALFHLALLFFFLLILELGMVYRRAIPADDKEPTNHPP